MFIISFFMASAIRKVVGILLAIVMLAVAFVVVFGVLAVTGGPGACTPGDGPITVDAANSASFQQKWDVLSATLNAGAPGSTAFSESELSSRADTYLKQHNVGFHNARVCIHNGSGEGSATFSLLGFHVKVKVTGTVDLSGSHPKAKVTRMDIGNVPGFLTAPAEKIVSRAIDSALGDVNLHHHYTSALTSGQAVVSGVP
jgi:hypothetical protein